MRNVSASFVVALALAAAPAVHAAGSSATPAKAGAKAEARMEAPRPAPELEQLKWIEGKWNCTGKGMGADGAMMDSKSTVNIKRDLNGFFYTGDYRQDAGAGMPEMKGTWLVGRDANGFAVMSYDSMGSMTMEKGGYSGEKLNVTGETVMNGKTVKTRELVAKKSDTEALHRIEQEKNGTWSPMIEETCRK